jgi:hypothetical protein
VRARPRSLPPTARGRGPHCRGGDRASGPHGRTHQLRAENDRS